MHRRLLATAVLLAACGGTEPEFHGTRVDETRPIPERGTYAKSVLSQVYPVAANDLNVHTEPLPVAPFSETEKVWIVGWKTDAEGAAGHVLPDDIQCHTLFTNKPLPQDEIRTFIGLCSDGFTPVFRLPEGFAIPVEPGERFYYQPMFNNRHPRECRVRMRLNVEFVKESERTRELRPLKSCVLSVSNPDFFWVPPMKRDTLTRLVEMPFQGRVHAIGGHIHPWGESLELRREETGERLFRAELSKADRLADCRLSTYSSKEGFFVRKGEFMTITCVYNNTTPHRIDAMGGFFLFYDPEGRERP